MASMIDATKPTAGRATTDSVRKNFQFAKQDIEYMQNQVEALVERVETLEQAISRMMTTDGGTITGDLIVQGNTTLQGTADFKSTVLLGIMPLGDMEAVPKGYLTSISPTETQE